jgi:hypothetical protein
MIKSRVTVTLLQFMYVKQHSCSDMIQALSVVTGDNWHVLLLLLLLLPPPQTKFKPLNFFVMRPRSCVRLCPRPNTLSGEAELL